MEPDPAWPWRKTVILFFPPKSSEKSLERFKQNSGLTHVNISKAFWLPFWEADYEGTRDIREARVDWRRQEMQRT